MSKKIFLVLLFLLLVAPGAQAQIQIVPDCSLTGTCNVCDFLATLINFTNIVSIAAGTTAVLMLIIGGVMWILGGANEGMIEKGKKLIIGTFTGLMIVFFAWTFVNFLIYAFAGGSLGSVRIFSREWWNPECGYNQSTSCEELNMGDKCVDEKHLCLNTSGAFGQSCSGGKCECVSWCAYMEATQLGGVFEELTCVANDSECADGYVLAGGEDSCESGRKCCAKINQK